MVRPIFHVKQTFLIYVRYPDGYSARYLADVGYPVRPYVMDSMKYLPISQDLERSESESLLPSLRQLLEKLKQSKLQQVLNVLEK